MINSILFLSISIFVILLFIGTSLLMSAYDMKKQIEYIIEKLDSIDAEIECVTEFRGLSAVENKLESILEKVTE